VGKLKERREGRGRKLREKKAKGEGRERERKQSGKGRIERKIRGKKIRKNINFI
jgi:hypothetical protein